MYIIQGFGKDIKKKKFLESRFHIRFPEDIDIFFFYQKEAQWSADTEKAV